MVISLAADDSLVICCKRVITYQHVCYFCCFWCVSAPL